MPAYAEWEEHFSHLAPMRITRMRSAIKVLLEDSMINEHYKRDLGLMDVFLQNIQNRRKRAKGR